VRRRVEDWAADKKHVGRDAWKFAAAKAYAKWVEDAEVTEDDYDAAVDAACNTSLNGY
jgi:hypothetical protein